MLRKLRNIKGQNTLEYAILFAIVVGALIAIQQYFKRGIEGKMKGSADEISAEQFDAAKTEASTTVTTSSKTSDSFKNGETVSTTGNNIYNKQTHYQKTANDK